MLSGSSKPQINHFQRSRYPHWHHSPPIELGTVSHPSIHADVLRGAPQYTPSFPQPQWAQGAQCHYCQLQTCKASSHKKQGEHV